MAPPIDYAAIAAGAADAVADFVERLHSHGYAVVRFEPAAEAEVAALRSLAAQFFALPSERKKAIGDLHSVGSTYAGYRDSASIDAEFLEVHTTPTGTYPPLAQPEGMSGAAAALFNRLDDMARLLLSVLATSGLGVDAEALLAPLDAPCAAADTLHDDGAEEGVSASVLRVCHYRRRAAEAGATGLEVLFEEHTDSSLLTLSTLCPHAPGLQLRDAADPDGEWITIEELEHVSVMDVEVHVGDFLSFLSRDYFPSCVHRVTRPRAGPGRLSFPFLVRPRQEHVLDTKRFDPTGTNARLVEISGIPCSHLRKLFDARGKRLLDARREVEEKEAARKARAKAYREAALAKMSAGGLSDSSDDELPARSRPPAKAKPVAEVAGKGADRSAGKSAGKTEVPRSTTDAPAPSAASSAVAPALTLPRRAVWELSDLGTLHHAPHFLYTFKQHDLHLDHAAEAVTLQTQLNHNFPHLADKKTGFGFRLVHQLDFATSGLLCVALSKKAAAAAGRLFEKRLVSKLYLALVDGHVAWEHASCDEAIGEDASDARGFRMAVGTHPGCTHPLPAHTDLYTVARGYYQGRAVTKVLMKPSTGRRHQLRLHGQALGHPVVGDVAYTGDTRSERMMLHAWRLRLPLPDTYAHRAREPVCVTTADPFVAEAGACAGTADAPMPLGDAVIELPDARAFDVDAVLEELRPSLPAGAAVNFRVLAPQGRPHATPGQDPVAEKSSAVGAATDTLQWRSRRRAQPHAGGEEKLAEVVEPAVTIAQAAKPPSVAAKAVQDLRKTEPDAEKRTWIAMGAAATALLLALVVVARAR